MLLKYLVLYFTVVTVFGMAIDACKILLMLVKYYIYVTEKTG